MPPASAKPFALVCSVRVLYADTDQMGIVNHAVALRWFEQARAEWLRQRGCTYRDIEQQGMAWPVYELSVRYLQPARYDDVLLLHARIDPPRPVRLAFHYQVLRQVDGVVLLTGTTHHACLNKNGRPRRIDGPLLSLLQAHADPAAGASTGTGQNGGPEDGGPPEEDEHDHTF